MPQLQNPTDDFGFREEVALALDKAAAVLDGAGDCQAFVLALEANKQIWDLLSRLAPKRQWDVPRSSVDYALSVTCRRGIDADDPAVQSLVDLDRRVSRQLCGEADFARLRARAEDALAGETAGFGVWRLAELAMTNRYPMRDGLIDVGESPDNRPAMRWGREFVTGMHNIDVANEGLFFLLNHLFDRGVECPGTFCIGDATCRKVDSLIAYLTRNLAVEEAVMEECDFPDRQPHCRDHREMIARLLEWRHLPACSNNYRTGLGDFIGNWVKRHINASDKPFAAWALASRRTLHPLKAKPVAGWPAQIAVTPETAPLFPSQPIIATAALPPGE